MENTQTNRHLEERKGHRARMGAVYNKTPKRVQIYNSNGALSGYDDRKQTGSSKKTSLQRPPDMPPYGFSHPSAFQWHAEMEQWKAEQAKLAVQMDEHEQCGERIPFEAVHLTPTGRYYDSNGALCGYDKNKQPCASADDDELIKLVQTQLHDKYEEFNHKHDIEFIIERHHRERIMSMQTPYGKQTKPTWAWDVMAVNEFWNAVSSISDYKKQTQPPKGPGKKREKLVTIKTAYGVQTKPVWVWEKEVADKQRGKKIVTIQTAPGTCSLPVWRWEEDAKTVFWRAVHGNNSSLSHMAVFSQGFPWQPPASWKIC